MYTKKMWTADGCLADHRQVLLNLPNILGAYVGRNAIEPSLNESVMVTVNSENSCPFCEGLHGELARMAGVEDVSTLMQAESLKACQQVSDKPRSPMPDFCRSSRGVRVGPLMVLWPAKRDRSGQLGAGPVLVLAVGQSRRQHLEWLLGAAKGAEAEEFSFCLS